MKKTMLLVDDIEFNRDLIKDLFLGEFYYMEASNGLEALNILEKHYSEIDILILDLMMPIMNGFELLEKINNDYRMCDIPTIVVTSDTNEQIEEKTLRLGADDVIIKPISLHILKKRIDNLIAKQEMFNSLRKQVFTNASLDKDNVEKFEGVGILSAAMKYDLNTKQWMISQEMHYLLAGIYSSSKDIVKYWNDMGIIKNTDVTQTRKYFREVITKTYYPSNLVIKMKTPDNVFNWIRISTSYLKEESAFIPILTLSNVNDFMATSKKLEMEATLDKLTLIYNRETFYLKVREMLLSQPSTEFVIVRWDIERFKVINDVYGTEMGDSLLIHIADALKARIKKNGLYSRINSDNFAACFENTDDSVEKFVDYITSSVSNYIINFEISIKFGVYVINDTTIPVSKMIDRAKFAIDKIKGNYAINVTYYDDSLRNSIVKNQEILNDMNDALEKEHFVVYLQPKCNLETGEINGAEALVRWNHPDKGLIQPNDFIPLLEKNGFITKIDYYVWDKVCQILNRWKKEGRKLLTISVNMSRVNLYNSMVVENIAELINKYDIDPKYLEIEITESAYIENQKQLLIVMNKMHDLGLNIAMDDFGSGYSSLNMLRNIPVDILKLDLGFLAGEDYLGRGGNILSSIIRMAKWLNLPVIAEGVETKEQMEFLKSLGCLNGQGYYYSKPIPLSDFEKLPISLFPFKEEAKFQSYSGIDLDQIWEPNSQANHSFNNYLGGCGIYELTNNNIEALRVNDGYYDITRQQKKDFNNFSKNMLELISPEYQERLLKLLYAMTFDNPIADFDFKYVIPSQEERVLRSRIKLLAKSSDNSYLFSAVFFNISDLVNK